MYMRPNGFEEGFNQIADRLKNFTKEEVKLWTPETDIIPVNYTINLSNSDNKLEQAYEYICTNFKNADKNLYWYKLEQLHITILGLIPLLGTSLPDAGVKDNNNKNDVVKRRNEIIHKVNEVFASYPERFEFRIGGFATNDKASSILAFPHNFDLYNLRNELKQALGIPGKDYSEYLNIFERISWIFFARFTKKPTSEYERLIKSSLEVDFGVMEFKPHLRINASSTLSDNEVTKSEIIHWF